MEMFELKGIRSNSIKIEDFSIIQEYSHQKVCVGSGIEK